MTTRTTTDRQGTEPLGAGPGSGPAVGHPASHPPITSAGPGVPFAALLRVETRKLVDTRSGRWLLIAIGLVTALVVTVLLFAADASDLTFSNLFGATAIPQGVLLPVLGILAVTSEWSQRTGLVTFTLEPRRMRVAVAKLLAAVLVGVLAVVLALGCAAVVNVLATWLVGGDGAWHLSGSVVGGAVLLQVLGVAQGVAFGMVLLNTPAAIVTYFALPMVWSILGGMVSWLHDAAQWLDLNVTTAPLVEGSMDARAWEHLATSVGLWVVLPLVVGVWRLLHREVK
ncbi:MAG TPA: ABC transporter permease [Segeticoccus sp.]|jgi:hypothetical protein|nr:ABC transporter permease [Segeticoccus sp.]